MTRIPEDLIIKFINNDCSDEELVAVRKWLEESDDNVAELFKTEQIVQQAAMMRDDDSTRRRIKAKLDQRIAQEKVRERLMSRHRLIVRAASVAAIVAIVVVTALFVLRTPDVKMVYVASAGERISVVLPDSSVVYLNKDSELSYPEQFASDSREVKLSGEGYFEVSRDRKRPFKVSGEYLTVEVLGTHFDFISRDTVANSVSLIEGSVEVSTEHQREGVVLEPGQKAVYSVSTGHLTVQNTNADVDASWHDGIIPFNNANIKEIVGILRQLYDCDIELDGNVDLNKTYSGVTVYCENLDSTLTRLSNTIPIRFVKKGDKTVIYVR